VAVIFISHSRRDEQLVLNIRDLLVNLGHTPIIEEFTPEYMKLPIPHDEIRRNVGMSNAVFLFLTDEIVRTEYTKNWVIFEDGLARERLIPIFVFERQGFPISYPIPYVTDYMVFNPESISDILNIQKLARPIGQVPSNWITGGLGALLGIPFGPLGIAIGGLGGLILGPKGEPPIPGIPVTCPYSDCRTKYNYWSPNIKNFQCPTCRRDIELRD